MSKKFPKKSTKVSMSVFGCFSAMGVQKHYKKHFTKKSTKNPKPFFLDFVLSRFWALLGEGSSKTPLKSIEKNKSDPAPFLASDPPTHHGGHDLFLAAPCPPGPGPSSWGPVGGWVSPRGFFGGRWWVGGWESGVFSAF